MKRVLVVIGIALELSRQENSIPKVGKPFFAFFTLKLGKNTTWLHFRLEDVKKHKERRQTEGEKERGG